MILLLKIILGKKVKEVSVGVVHAMALTDQGEVYTWGKKEYAHMSDSCSDEPSLITQLPSTQTVGIAAGPTQVCVDV